MTMPGNNKLVLNEATMIEALDYWLRNKVIHPDRPCPAVKGVAEIGHGFDKSFEVQIEGAAP